MLRRKASLKKDKIKSGWLKSSDFVFLMCYWLCLWNMKNMSWPNLDWPELRFTTNSFWTNYRKRKQAQFSVLSFAGAHKLLQDEGCYLRLAHLFQSISVGWELVCLSRFFSPPTLSLNHPATQSTIWCTPNPSQPSLNFCSFHNKATPCNLWQEASAFCTRMICYLLALCRIMGLASLKPEQACR